MTEYKKLESVEDVPQSLTQLTHDWMVDYVVAQNNPADAADLLEFEEAHQKAWTSNLKDKNGKERPPVMKTDIKEMRKWFCSRYFPHLLQKKSKKDKLSNLSYSKSKLAELAARANQKPAAASSRRKTQQQQQ